MTIEADIVTQLNGYAGLTALIGSRVYPVKFPQGATLPCVIFTRVTGNHVVTLDNAEKENPRYQMDVLAETYSSLRAVVVQVKAAMNAATTYKSVLIADNDLLFDDAQENYRAAIDFSVWP